MFEDKLAREATSSSRALPRLCIRKVEQSLSEPGPGPAQTEHWHGRAHAEPGLFSPVPVGGGGRRETQWRHLAAGINMRGRALPELGRHWTHRAPASSQAQMLEAGLGAAAVPSPGSLGQPRGCPVTGSASQAGRGEARESSILFPTASVGWNRPAGQQ